MDDEQDFLQQDDNPFRAPEVQDVSSGAIHSNAEAMRNEHLSHEASIQSVGCLYLIGGILFCFGAILGLVVLLTQAGNGPVVPGVLEVIVIPALAFVQCTIGYGLRKLKSWVRLPGGIVAGLGLLAFPFGTIINGYILYLLMSKKGATVLSPEYQDIIRQTPHIKYRTSPIVWGCLVVLIVVIVAGLGVALFSG